MFRHVVSIVAIAIWALPIRGQEVVEFSLTTNDYRDHEDLQQKLDQQGGTFQVGPSPNPLDVVISLNVPPDLPQRAAVQNELSVAVGAIRGDPIAFDSTLVDPNQVSDDRRLCQPATKAFSWKTHLTAVKRQGVCQGCWAFGVMAAVEAHLGIAHDFRTDGSEQFLIDCNKGKSSCVTGGWFDDPLRLLAEYGGVTEQEVGYVAKDSDCAPTIEPTYKVVNWGYVDRAGGIPSQKWMKTALCRYGPLSVGVRSTPLFARYTGGLFNERDEGSGTSDVNHAVLIYGWDDAEKSWLIKNSWGDDWGDKGHMRIHYDSNNIGYGATWMDVVPVEGNRSVIAAIDVTRRSKTQVLRDTVSGIPFLEGIVDRVLLSVPFAE